MTDDDVAVSRKQLRSMRSLVAGVLVGFLLFGGAWVAKLFSDQDRCEDTNALLHQHIPAAFDAYSHFLGEEMGAEDTRIEDAAARSRARIEALFPPEDCSLWAVATG